MMTMTTFFRDSTASFGTGLPSMGLVFALLTALISLGCGEEKKAGPPPVHPFKLQVSVVDSNDNPVPKAPVLLDGKPVGYTDRAGLFEAVINERQGTEIELSVGTMDDYLVPRDALKTETLKLAKTLEGDRQPISVEIHTVVRSARQDYLVWLDIDCGEHLDKAKCQDLPVMYNGKEVARTDDVGKAHFAFTEVPSETVTISLDTPTYEPSADDDEDDTFVMKPADPSYDIELGLETEVLQISETFTDPIAAQKAEKADDKAQRRRQYRRRRRSRKKAASEKKEKKEEEKKSDVIELW
jgi:hypothetical protein